MRKLVWFAIGLGTATAVGAYLFSGMGLLLVGVCLLLGGIGLFLLCKNSGKKLALFLCGAAAGLLWYQCHDMVYLNHARQMDQQIQTVSIRCTDYGYDTGYGSAVDGQITIGKYEYKVRVYLDEDIQILPGTMLHGTFRFRYTSPGGGSEPTYHRGQGIFLIAYQQKEITAVHPAEPSARYGAAYLRYHLLQSIDRLFSEDVAPFTRALLLGDTTQLDYETQTHLMLSGIRHVAAVSGLHVSILFSLIYLLFGRKRYLSALIGIPCLVLFAALSGFTASVVRACVMQGLMLLAWVLNKEYDPPSALALAVIVMLFANPQIITSVGFQLSVASVAGIFLFSGRIYGYLTHADRPWQGKSKTIRARIVGFIAGSVSVSLSAQVFTVPLTALYFETISLVGMLTNLLCLWAVTILFCGILLSCVFSFMYLPIGKVFAWLVSWVARYVLGFSALIAKIPCCAVYTKSIYVVFWLIFCYVLLMLYLFFRGKKPAIFAPCAVLGLCVSLLASWIEPTLDDYRMTVLDVGQGQCILLQSNGKTFMVDCGGDRDDSVADQAAALLNSQGIYRLDGLIVTHNDRDHAGGVANLLKRIPVDLLVLPPGQSEDWYAQFADGAVKERMISDEDIHIQWDSVKMTVFCSNLKDTKNDTSACILFQHEKCDILITGDRSQSGELELIRKNNIPPVDVLVVGHHGAKDATGSILLGTVNPKTAVISVSEYNTYGHPAEEVLRRLASYGCAIYRTDLNGTVLIRG